MAGSRLACVDLPALPLQLLLHGHPDWGDGPAAVVAEDRPQGRILWINEAARRQRVLPGMSWAAGLSLAPKLRAGVVERARVEVAVSELVERLRRYTPGVEPCPNEPGVFWLDASGLGHLHPSLGAWAELVMASLQSARYHASLAVGFTRFGTYAIARGWRGVRLLDSPAAEREATGSVSLARLGIEPKVRDALGRLGVRTVEEFMALPADGLQRRFGADARRLWLLAAGEWRPRLRSAPELPPVHAVLHLDHAERNATRLLFLIKRLLPSLQHTLVDRLQVLSRLHLRLHLEKGEPIETSIRPAEPTLSTTILQDLLRLRLDALELTAPVTDIEVDAEGVAGRHDQLRLGFDRPRRDLDAAARALARLRTELGDDAILCACLADGHLPEASFRWQRLDRLSAPAPREVTLRTLVRRIEPRSRPLPPQSRHVRDDGWLVQGLTHGSVVRTFGPYLLSGGWWRREVHREYQFAETQRGDLLWLYYDRHRRRWFLQGIVE